MIRRLLGLGAAACLLAGTTAGSASAAAAGAAAGPAGSIWQVVPSQNPQPHLVTDSDLASVSMGSATDGWAVGSFLAANAVGHPLVEHWDGTAWTRVPAPMPSGTQAGLAGVDELSTGNAWAVGDSANGSPGEGNIGNEPLIEHWNGSAWSIVNGVTLPSGSTGVLNAIGGTGTAWSVVPAPCLTGQQVTACSGATNDLNQLTGVVAISSSDAWASGSEGNVNDQNFHIPYVEHWNGTAWSLVKTPNRGGEGSLLNGITALGPGDVWAVGQTQQLNGAIMPMTDQFNGTSWSVVPSPVPGSSGRIPDDSLDGAASLSGGLVFAVGARDAPGQCCLRTPGTEDIGW